VAGAGPEVDDRARVDGDARHEVGHRARALVGVAEVEGRVPVAWHDGSVLSQYLDVNNLDIKIHTSSRLVSRTLMCVSSGSPILGP